MADVISPEQETEKKKKKKGLSYLPNTQIVYVEKDNW